ncbi:MAG: helix-turn-helix domain-containing protein [[Mycobacterium] stephanolepidis]
MRSLLDIGTVGSTFLPQLAQGATNAANSFAKFVADARETGRMQQWIQTGIDAMRQLGDIAGNLGSTIAGVFRAGQGVGGGFLSSLQTVTQTMSDFVNSAQGRTALGAFFTGANEALAALSPILKTVGESVLGTILPAFTSLGTAAAPALQAVFTNLAEVMKTLAPVVTSLSGPISTLLNALGPAVVVGVHRSVISKFENQTEDPKLSTLLRYAHAVGADLDFGVRQGNAPAPQHVRPATSVSGPVGQTTRL